MWACRDVLPAYAAVLFSLLSVSFSAPLVCEKLLHPLDLSTPRHLEGRWALVAGSLSHAASLEALKQRDSITMYFNLSGASTLSYNQVNRFGDDCQHLPYNISVEGSRFTFDVGNRFNLTGAFLQTSCPDCLVMQWIVESRRRHSVDLYLLSRRREVELKEMEEFKAQLKCYQLPPPVVMEPTRKLCPEQDGTRLAAATAQNEARVGEKAKAA